jgi:glycosyltransferase involved in cell wall biosynthesis
MKILELLNNPELRKKMGMAGREKVAKSFDIRTRVKELEDLYLQLYAKARS